jgi:hypothetical protein
MLKNKTMSKFLFLFLSFGIFTTASIVPSQAFAPAIPVAISIVDGVITSAAVSATGATATTAITSGTLAAGISYSIYELQRNIPIWIDAAKSLFEKKPISENWVNIYSNNFGWELNNRSYINNTFTASFSFPSSAVASDKRCSFNYYDDQTLIETTMAGCNYINPNINKNLSNITGVSVNYIYDYVSNQSFKQITVIQVGTAPNTTSATAEEANEVIPPKFIEITTVTQDGKTIIEKFPYEPGQKIVIGKPSTTNKNYNNNTTYKVYDTVNNTTSNDINTVNNDYSVKDQSVVYKEYNDNTKTYTTVSNIYDVKNATYPVTNNNQTTYESNLYNPQTNQIYNTITNNYTTISPQTKEVIEQIKEDPNTAPENSPTIEAEGGDCGSILSNPLKLFGCLFVPTKATNIALEIKSSFNQTFIGQLTGYIYTLGTSFSYWLNPQEEYTSCEGIAVPLPFEWSGYGEDMIIHPFSTCHPLLQQYLPYLNNFLSAFIYFGGALMIIRKLANSFNLKINKEDL